MLAYPVSRYVTPELPLVPVKRLHPVVDQPDFIESASQLVQRREIESELHGKLAPQQLLVVAIEYALALAAQQSHKVPTILESEKT